MKYAWHRALCGIRAYRKHYRALIISETIGICFAVLALSVSFANLSQRQAHFTEWEQTFITLSSQLLSTERRQDDITPEDYRYIASSGAAVVYYQQYDDYTGDGLHILFTDGRFFEYLMGMTYTEGAIYAGGRANTSAFRTLAGETGEILLFAPYHSDKLPYQRTQPLYSRALTFEDYIICPLERYPELAAEISDARSLEFLLTPENFDTIEGLVYDSLRYLMETHGHDRYSVTNYYRMSDQLLSSHKVIVELLSILAVYIVGYYILTSIGTHRLLFQQRQKNRIIASFCGAGKGQLFCEQFFEMELVSLIGDIAGMTLAGMILLVGNFPTVKESCLLAAGGICILINLIGVLTVSLVMLCGVGGSKSELGSYGIGVKSI